jgi:two-component sensor histidine kinase
MPRTLRMTAPVEVGSAVAARRAVVGFGGPPESTLLELEVVVGELVSNAIRHPGSPRTTTFDVTVTYHSDHLRLDVTDHGHGFDPAALPRNGDEREGFGLKIVAALARSWGVDARTGTVWAELTWPRRAA